MKCIGNVMLKREERSAYRISVEGPERKLSKEEYN
jgi:hypothetical protein